MNGFRVCAHVYTVFFRWLQCHRKVGHTEKKLIQFLFSFHRFIVNRQQLENYCIIFVGVLHCVSKPILCVMRFFLQRSTHFTMLSAE